MIKRLSARRSHGTLVANPRKKRKAAKRGHKRAKRRSLSAMLANPKHKRKHANPKHKRKHRNPMSARRKRRNPAIGGIDFGGVNLVNVGVGSVATIALGAIGEAVFNKYLAKNIENETLRAMAPNLIVAGAAWAAHKYVKNQMVKDVAKVTIALSVFKAINDSFGKQITEGVQKILPATSGTYTPVSGNYALSGGGMYIDTTTGGSYATSGPTGIFPSANLYGL
jgi:hypothetical protein